MPLIQTRTKRVPKHLFDLGGMAESLMGYGGYGWTWTTDPSIMNIVLDSIPLFPYNTLEYIITPINKGLHRECFTLIDTSIP